MAKSWIPEKEDLKLMVERFKINQKSISGLSWRSGRSIGNPALSTLQSDKKYFRGNFTCSDGKIRQLLAHRLVHFLNTGKWALGVVDHVDGNGLNNSKDNLREVSMSGNLLNQRSKCYRFREDLIEGWEVTVQYRGIIYRSVCGSEENAKREVKRLKASIAPEMCGSFSWGEMHEISNRINTQECLEQ